MTSSESVIIRCQDHAAVGVTFRDRFSFDADYRGWDGERSWRTDDADLTVAAVFRSGGYVGLTWTASGGGWGASVTTWLEAGEQVAALAAGIRQFLRGER
ncbi:DUF6228 family protein [Streptomyces niveus]|uniref:DUF6228 family protein n=1 Tax=Streptomyces niveus TaxID=193462 RepID=UPI0035D6857E